MKTASLASTELTASAAKTRSGHAVGIVEMRIDIRGHGCCTRHCLVRVCLLLLALLTAAHRIPISLPKKQNRKSKDRN